jgi:hypothetical protein
VSASGLYGAAGNPRPICTGRRGERERSASGLYWGEKGPAGRRGGTGAARRARTSRREPARALPQCLGGVGPGSAFRLWWSLGGKGAQGPGDVQSKAQSKAAALLRGEMLRFLYGETLWFLILLACITRRRCGASGFSAGATRPSRRGGGAGGADATSATRSEVGDQTCYFPEKERA